MRAYKFLRPGGFAPFTGYEWRPGEWVEASAPVPCRNGVHACSIEQLPYWLAPELWEVELGGEIVKHERKLVAARARLSRRVDGWNADTAAAFRDWAVARARDRTPDFVDMAEEIAASGRTALTAFVAARGAEVTSGREAYFAERRAQSDWLADRLSLAD